MAKTKLVFLSATLLPSLEEKVGSQAGKKGIFSANTVPGPRANTAHSKSALLLLSDPAWVDDSHAFLRMVTSPSESRPNKNHIGESKRNIGKLVTM